MPLTDHLATGQTTLCYCWIVYRKDGVTLGFTDHDQNLVVDGVTCYSTTGIMTTRFEQSLGLQEDDLEVEGVVDDDRITEDDLRARRYDDADVALYVVNWSDPTQYEIMTTGNLGEITEADDGTFLTEFLSLSAKLSQPRGDTFQRTCQAVLGDNRCRVDLTNPAFRGTATVTSVSETEIGIALSSSYQDGWFSLGKMVTAAGYEAGIRIHSGNTISLWAEPDVTIAVGDTIQVVTGCAQDHVTCRTKFNNILNFRGHHLMPGDDVTTTYAVRGQGKYVGESLFK